MNLTSTRASEYLARELERKRQELAFIFRRLQTGVNPGTGIPIYEMNDRQLAAIRVEQAEIEALEDALQNELRREAGELAERRPEASSGSTVQRNQNGNYCVDGLEFRSLWDVYRYQQALAQENITSSQGTGPGTAPEQEQPVRQRELTDAEAKEILEADLRDMLRKLRGWQRERKHSREGDAYRQWLEEETFGHEVETRTQTAEPQEPAEERCDRMIVFE